MRALLTRVVAALVVVLLVGPLPRAAADPIDDKRAEAQRITSQLEAQGDRLSELAEQFNLARLRADEVESKAAAAEAEVSRLDQQLDRTRQLLRDQAVEAYMRGHIPAIPDPTNIDPSRMQAYVETIMGRRREALDAMRQARLALSEQQAELDAARRDARAALAAMDASRQAAESATAAQRATLDRVQGELASLVDAETQRRAEVEARRAQQAAVRTARDDGGASIRPATRGGTTGGTTGDTPRGTTGTTAKPRTAKPAEPDGPAPGPPASGASAAVAKAKEQLGKPYEYGAAGPNSFDCSGLTQYAWKAGGKSLPHSSRAQYSATTRVSTSALVPGDLVFYGSPIHHVGIYVGNGQMVEASQTGTPVRYASIWRRDLVGAGRVY